MKVAVVYGSKVVKIIEVENTKQIPSEFEVEIEIDRGRKELRRLEINEVILRKVEGVDVGDIYVEGKGFYKFVGK